VGGLNPVTGGLWLTDTALGPLQGATSSFYSAKELNNVFLI
jgi:hypothetical protein